MDVELKFFHKLRGFGECTWLKSWHAQIRCNLFTFVSIWLSRFHTSSAPRNTREHSGNTSDNRCLFHEFPLVKLRSHDLSLTIFGFSFSCFSSFPANGLVCVTTTNVRLEFRVHVLFRQIYGLNVVNLVPSTLEYAFLERILDMARSWRNVIELLVCVCIALDFAQTIGERISIISLR